MASGRASSSSRRQYHQTRLRQLSRRLARRLKQPQVRQGTIWKGTPMFQLALVDHLRMTFGHIVYRHRAHTRVAYSRLRWNRGFRAAEALLMTGVAVAALGAAFGRGYAYEIAGAVLAVLALTTFLLHLTLDLDRSAQAHAACAARLWRIREQYRGLLSDLSDGAIDMDAVRR